VTSQAGNTITLSGSPLLPITRSLTIRNGTVATPVTINGSALGSVFTIGDGTNAVNAQLSGLTLTNGSGPAGLDVKNAASLTLDNIAVTNSNGSTAGGIWVEGGGSLNAQ